MCKLNVFIYIHIRMLFICRFSWYIDGATITLAEQEFYGM